MDQGPGDSSTWIAPPQQWPSAPPPPERSSNPFGGPPPPPPNRTVRRLTWVISGLVFALAGAVVALVVLQSGGNTPRVTPRSTGESAPSAGQSARAPRLIPISPDTVCRRGGLDWVTSQLDVDAGGPLPVRLSDEMPKSSPITGLQVGFDGPLQGSELTRPWQQLIATEGMQEAYARTFNSSSHPGGFTVYVFQMTEREAALVAATRAYEDVVCRMGGEPYGFSGEPGALGATQLSDTALALWVHGSRIIDLEYPVVSGSRDAEAKASVAVSATRAVETATYIQSDSERSL
jgi:hypothetical protein